MNQNTAFDPGIPVLTEVFQDQPVKKDVPGAAEAATEAAPPAAGDAGLEARALAQWTEPEWALLERRLAERVVQQLQGRIDLVLEQCLRDSIAEAVQRAMAGLAGEIRASLQHTIGQVVGQAVAQELAHLHTLKQ